MSFSDLFKLKCINCGEEDTYDEWGAIPHTMSDTVSKKRVEFDCSSCGKRFILEFRRKPDPKNRKKEVL